MDVYLFISDHVISKTALETDILNLNRVVMYDASKVDDVVNTCNILKNMCMNFDTKLVPFFDQPIFKSTATSTIRKQIEQFRHFLKTIVGKLGGI